MNKFILIIALFCFLNCAYLNDSSFPEVSQCPAICASLNRLGCAEAMQPMCSDNIQKTSACLSEIKDPSCVIAAKDIFAIRACNIKCR